MPSSRCYVLLLWAALAWQGCCPGSAKETSSSASATGSAPPPPPEVTCKYTQEKKVLKCPPERTQACAGTDVLCRGSYFAVASGATVNNWEKDKLWAKRKNEVSFVAFKVAPKAEEREGRTCLKGSARADVWLCWKDPSRVPKAAASVFGYGRMFKYEEGVVTDDLYIDMLDVLTQEAGIKESEAINFDRLAGQGSDSPAKRVAFLKALRNAEERLGKDEAYRIAVLRGVDVEDITAKAETEAAQADAEKKSLLERSAFMRLEAVSVDLNPLKGNEWVLPSAAACGKNPPGKDEFERKANGARRGQLSKELAARLFLLKLELARPEDKAGEYDFSTKKLPLVLSSDDSSVSLSGVAPIKGEVVMEDFCCVPFGECRIADGLMFKSCQPGEIRTRKPMGALQSFDDDATSKRLSIVLEPDAAKEAIENFDKIAGRAVVRIKGVARVCDGTDVSSVKLLAEVIGLQLALGKKVLHESARAEVTVEEAMAGPEQWLEKKVPGAARK